jgi:hypothetical protein
MPFVLIHIGVRSIVMIRILFFAYVFLLASTNLVLGKDLAEDDKTSEEKNDEECAIKMKPAMLYCDSMLRLDWDRTSADDIALALTIRDASTLLLIARKEITDWINDPNGNSIINFINRQSDKTINWIIDQLLSADDKKNILQKLYDVAKKLYESNNLHSLLQLTLALSQTHKYNLPILKGKSNELSIYKDLFIPFQNYKNIHNHLAALQKSEKYIFPASILCKDFQTFEKKASIENIETAFAKNLELLGICKLKCYKEPNDMLNPRIFHCINNLPAISDNEIDAKFYLQKPYKPIALNYATLARAPLSEWNFEYMLIFLLNEEKCVILIRYFYDRGIFCGQHLIDFLGNFSETKQQNFLTDFGMSQKTAELLSCWILLAKVPTQNYNKIRAKLYILKPWKPGEGNLEVMAAETLSKWDFDYMLNALGNEENYENIIRLFYDNNIFCGQDLLDHLCRLEKSKRIKNLKDFGISPKTADHLSFLVYLNSGKNTSASLPSLSN